MKSKPEEYAIGDMTRRDFLKQSLIVAGALAAGALEGCASKTIRNVPELDYSGILFLKNCRVVDVVNGKVSAPSQVQLIGERIHAVETGGTPAAAPGRTIDLGGAYLIPGLIDAHAHPTITATFRVDSLDLFRHMNLMKRNFALLIESGVTSVRDMGSFPVVLHDILEDIRDGKLVGPRVVYCNSFLNLDGAHPDLRARDFNVLGDLVKSMIGMPMINFKDMRELKRVIVDNSGDGASFIKLSMDNTSIFCREPDGICVYSDEMLRYIFDYAEGKGLPVAGHVLKKWGFDRAMQYPFYSLEHIVSDCELTDPEVDLIAKRNIFITPTMTMGIGYLMEEAYDVLPDGYTCDFMQNELRLRREYLQQYGAVHCDPVIHRKNMEDLKKYRTMKMGELWKNKVFLVNPRVFYGMLTTGTRNLLKLREAGVTLGCGIDAGMPLSYFGGLYREMEFFSRIGFRNDEILRMATINGARILGIADVAGIIAKGRFADLVALPANPLEDVTAYRAPEVVIRGGKVLYSRHPLRCV